jgi:hypothetical protein
MKKTEAKKMSATIPVNTSLVKVVTQFVDTLHRHYSGIKIQPVSKYENEDLTFEIAIPSRLSLEQVLETCHKECLKAEDEHDLFIFSHVVYET